MHGYVPGAGPLPPLSGVVLIGEAPGFSETERGVPFVGKAGRELDQLLDRAGLPRQELYLTNLVKLQPPVINNKQQPPSKQMISEWEPELLMELAAAQPLWIGAIGRYAARWLIGDVDMEYAHGMAFPLRAAVAEELRAEQFTARRVEERMRGGWAEDEDSDARTNIGIRLKIALNGGGGGRYDDSWLEEVRVVPLYHPAAGLHNPEVQPMVWSDVRTFSAYVHGRLHPETPVDRHPHPRYVEGLGRWPGVLGLVGVDTEGTVPRPWSLQLAHKPGSGSLVRYASLPAQRPAVHQVLRNAEKLIFQNVLWDQEIFYAMGLPLDWSKVEDCYLMADVLRLVPRGLKAGARRDCGMEMKSYSEVIGPAERRLAREYVDAAIQARICFTCGGDGKIIDSELLAKRYAKSQKGGKQLEDYKGPPMLKCPEPSCVAGGIWTPREPEVEFDWDSGLWKFKSGWEVQQYLRRLRADIEAGKLDEPEAGDQDTEQGDEAGGGGDRESPRSRVAGWPEQVKREIEGALGCQMPEAALEDVPRKEAVDYAVRDSDATLRRYPILLRQVRELGLEDAYRLDLSVMPVAAEMQRNGMMIDRDHFRRLSEELQQRKERVAEELADLVGRRLNPASGDQVADLLFARMKKTYDLKDAAELEPVLGFGLMPEKWTPSGKRGSTDEKTLEGLKLKYATDRELVRAIELILDFRMCDKIDSTYACPLPRYADAQGRVHTRIKIGPATFRWACGNPPLHQIPTREKHGETLGRRVREGFVAPPGRLLGARDFSQVEVRVMAWYAQDRALLKLFRDAPTCPVALAAPGGECRCHDIHYVTASLIFRTPLELVTKDQRVSAKNIIFGIIYGITARGLKAQMDLRGQNWSVEECQRLIDMYLYEAYPGIGEFVMEAQAEARRENMVRSLVGHIRYCPAVHSAIPSIREEALRQAVNFKIQCSSAELLKIAERELWVNCRERFQELDALLLMSVHDELIVETPDDPDVVAEVDALMKSYMDNPWPLEGVEGNVEVLSSGKWGRSWAEVK